MAGLHFQGRADAYLEWSVASGFRWVSAPAGRPDQVDLLVQSPGPSSPAVHVARSTRALLRTGPGALPAWPWMELAQAIPTQAGLVIKPAQVEFMKPISVLGLIDSGLGRAWLSIQPFQPRVLLWDMDPASLPLPRVSHGAHVLSWLAGQPPYPGVAWQGDVASRCPLILVNLPAQAVDDPTGRWLGRYVLEGLDHMVRQALALEATHLVVNISWGPQTGPHDGSSLLERALVERIHNAKNAGLRVDIVLAAGNSRESRAHAQFDAAQGCPSLTWVVPPAGPAPCFLEIWWPPGTDLSQADVRAVPPGPGSVLHLRGAGLASTARAHAIIVPHPHSDGRMCPMALLALHPSGDPLSPAPHGRWTIHVDGIPGSKGLVHVYVARQSANLGARYRGLNSHLEDAPGSTCVSQAGTLSGLAGADHDRLHVAAGAVLSTRQAAHYSSEGPLAGGVRRRPDWAWPTDETPMLQGLLGAGSRPGSTVRLTGTSLAAPQLARCLVNGGPLPMPDSWDQRLGCGVAPLGWHSRQRP